MELGYMKLPAAGRSLFRLIVFKRHGMVVGDTPFFSALIEGLERQSRSMGYDLAVSHTSASEADRKEFQDLLQTDHAEGFIVLATEMLPEDLELLADVRRPVVLLDSRFRDCPFDSVLINNTDAAYRATRHLVELGHSRIGYLHSSVYINNFRDRETGYMQALCAAGLAPDPACRYTLEPTMEGAYRDMCAALDLGGDALLNGGLPTAFFADNDIIAYGAMKALLERGIRLPDELSIVGVDDMPFCEMTHPRLTTVRVPKQEIGGLAIRRLVEKMQGDTNVLTIETGTELIRRESDQSPSKKNA